MQVLNSCNNKNFFINNNIKTSAVNKKNNFGKIDGAEKSFCADSFELNKNISLKESFAKIKAQQGIIGKTWDGIKNLFRMKSGSKSVEKIILQAQKGEITKEEAQKAIQKYKDGQNMCVDVAADIASGILAIAAFTLAVPTGGASLAIGLAAATATGAGVKIGIKVTDAALTGKEYTKKDLIHDSATGAINGIMAPVTNGIGASITKTIGKKLGLTIIGEGAKEVAGQGIKQAAKSVLLTQCVDVAGGTVTKRAIALGAGMAVDGALSGAADNMVRAGLNGEDIAKAGIQGAIGGAIAAPVIGGGFRIASKAGKALNNKITTRKIFPEGLNTKFKQGQTGDCAVLSMMDGMLNNPETADLVRNSVTKSAFGDYNVKIGDTIVKVSKDALTDEMLSDTTGIRIFEQAYKQLHGTLDGGFAETAAKQFGLNPVHITQDGITDELLDRLAREQGNTVLSFGTLVDTDGAISASGGQRHYFSIREINADAKTVTLSNTLDTSKTIKLSYDDIKDFGISIDGGTVRPTDLPNAARRFDEALFEGIDISRTKKQLVQGLQQSENEINKKISKAAKGVSLDDIAAIAELNGFDTKEVTELLYKPLVSGDDKLVSDAIKTLNLHRELQESSLFDAFKLSLKDTDAIRKKIDSYNFEGIYDILMEKDGDLALRLLDADSGKGFYEKYSRELKEIVDNAVLKGLNSDDVVRIGVVNGKNKYVILKNSTRVSSSTVPIEAMPDLIKSNLVTSDLLEIVQKQGFSLPDEKLGRIIHGKTVIKDIPYSPNELMRKAQQFGIDSLNSHEIHILTDCLENLYKDNSSFRKLANGITNNTNLKEVYGYVVHLKKMASKILPANVEIEDHAFMRMLDRNLLSVTDNKTLKRLSFEEFIHLLAENAKKGNTSIKGYNGSGSIDMLLKRNGNKVIIDSVFPS